MTLTDPESMSLRLPLLLACMLLANSADAQVSVVSVFPQANEISADAGAQITATFSAPIDTASLSPMSFSVFGLWSGVVRGNLSVSSDGLSVTFKPDREYSAGERVTVSIARTLSSTGGADLAHGYAWHFFVATQPASIAPVLTTRISVRRKGEAWIQTYGAYAGDFDEDGYTDLAVPNERTNDFRLFLNDGSGMYRQFDTYPIPAGNRPSVNEGADFNMDGHIDFVVGNSTGNTVGLFMGDGKGALTAGTSFPVGFGVRGLAVMDLNGDNYPDVASASRQSSTISTLVNNRVGAFGDAATFSTPATGETAAVAADMNEDGIMDLVVGSFISAQMVVLLGNGEGGVDYRDIFNAGGTVWMIAAGDVNGDGHADIVSGNAENNSVSVLLGDGTGNLAAPTVYASDFFTIAIDLGDLDGDGDLDMVSSNFGSTGAVGSRAGGSWVVYENAGDGSFTRRMTYASDGAGSCVVLHDRNNDGALDITAIDELRDELVILTNALVITDTETNELPESDFSLAVYPNPTSEKATVNVSISRPADVTIEIFDTMGRMVRTSGSGINQSISFDLDVKSLSPGSYFITASSAAEKRTAVLQVAR